MREGEGKLSVQCLTEQEKKSFPQEGVDLLYIIAPVCQVPWVPRVATTWKLSVILADKGLVVC